MNLFGKAKKRTQNKPSFVRKLVLRLSALLLLTLLLSGGYAGYLQLTGNFHTVASGALYRSAQPSAQDIAKYQTEYGIKTIINLRGEHKGEAWYDNELAKAKQLNIKLVNFPMSDGTVLSEQDAKTILLALKDLPKPILIHCRAGSDRSGLVAALYEAGIAKKGEANAESQISFRYGHVSLPYISRAYAMDVSFEQLEPMLKNES